MRETDQDWMLIAQNEPFHSVLAQDKFLRRNLTPETLEEFWCTGEVEMQYFASVIRRHFGEFKPTAALDFGCGVGRLTRAMAAIADEVVGLDIAPVMLAEASRYALENARYATELTDETFDWISSVIVFQHIPPVRGYAIFEDLLARLRPGGVISVQFTLFKDQAFLPSITSRLGLAAWDGEVLKALHQSPEEPGTMLMYDYDLTRLVAILIEWGIEQFFLEHTDHGGCHGVRLFGRRSGD